MDGSAICQKGHGLKMGEEAGMAPMGNGGRTNYFQARLLFLKA